MMEKTKICKGKPMAILKEKLKKAIYEINHNDMDWLHVCSGKEGIGKSSLAVQICKYVDPNFSEKETVFSIRDFMDVVKNSNKGQAVLIDEGALLVLRRDAMTQDVKRMIKLLTVCRNYNLFICICIPKLNLLDSYVINHRIRSWTKVVLRGRYFVYNKHRIIKMVKFLKYPYKKLKKPKPMFKESFLDSKKELPDLWLRYLEKKKRLLDRHAGKKQLDIGGVTILNFAKMCNKTKRTVLGWVEKKLIDAYKDPTGSYVIPQHEVDKLRNGGFNH